MKFAIKSIVAAAAFVAAGAASAAATTVNVGDTLGGLQLGGGAGVLSFSVDLMSALDIGQVTVSSYSPGTASVTKDSFGSYSNVSASAPITSVTVDTATNNLLSVATAGGATQTSPVLKGVSIGGSLTVSDLNVDLANKKVYATVIGGNGVGTLSNFYLWDIVKPVTTEQFIAGNNRTLSAISGLQITSGGFNTFVQALGLLPLGKGALQSVTDFGTITTTMTVTPVPEPATYALMALGVAAIGVAARRRRA
ncbi:MAG: PEP-CTERM sorting domain-containing protein [Burkholderiales bacterium]|nr:PEP-CTERM sorting domain-containing protein [Burkholderiales bacterium]MDE2077813.1 PEP-CTERM sorting domain-containing protein [Burkholderiales bacterium]MDE2431667.1 PEP-CTERM sorting domain-containing protein [Burkholderiales bacterium]